MEPRTLDETEAWSRSFSLCVQSSKAWWLNKGSGGEEHEQEEKEERRPRSHPWPLPGRHNGTGTEDREASRRSAETRQHNFPLAKEPVKPLTRRRRRKWSSHGGTQRHPSPFCRIKRRHKGSVVLSAGLLGERINLFHSALRAHATEREHSATSEHCLSKDARSCSYRASPSLRGITGVF